MLKASSTGRLVEKKYLSPCEARLVHAKSNSPSYTCYYFALSSYLRVGVLLFHLDRDGGKNGEAWR